MKIVQTLASLLAIATTLVACTSEVDSHPTHPTADNEVSLSLPVDTTRASIESDGRNTRWVPGDKLAVWAMDANGEYVFSNALFSMRHYSTEYDLAFFSGNVAEMAKGDYTYLLSYPYPQSVEGTKATYRVSDTQSGNYDGKYDIMVAEPVVAKALSAKERVELNTVTKHQMHALKINVPEGRNLYGDRFYRLEITFPTDVVGDITVDVSDPNAEPTYTNTSNVIVVEREEGFDVGDDIWVFVLPGTVEGDVTYRVRGERRHSEYTTFPMSRTLERGHVTPVRMMIPVVYPIYTSVNISVEKNNLGEDFNYFDLYEGDAYIGRYQRNASNKYVVFDQEGEFNTDAFDNRNLRIVFDSDNAIVESTVNTGVVAAYTDNICNAIIPYLFEEDFSLITESFGDGHDAPGVGGDSDTYNSATMFSDNTANARMANWSGGRYQVSAGEALRICCRSECGLYVLANYRGRIDSAPISALKSGANVKVKVQFNYSDAFEAYQLSGNTQMSFGYTTSEGAIAPSTDVSNKLINKQSISSKSGSFTNIPSLAEVSFSGCTNATRLTWMAESSVGRKFAGNANSWLYIDNIRVSITK